MKQQIRFFECLTQLKIMKNVPIILFLNKTDVLERLISGRPISNYFEDYTGGKNCFLACQFFADKFAKSDHREVGDLRIYGTCAAQGSCFGGILKDLQNSPCWYNKTGPSNRLRGKANIHYPVPKASLDEMLTRESDEERKAVSLRYESLRPGSIIKNPPVSCILWAK